MQKKLLFALWGGFYILCAGLGFIPAPTGVQRGLLTCLSLLFFLPPALLYRDAAAKKDRTTLKLLRNLSALSLLLTAGLINANFFSLLAPQWLGNVLYGILVMVSSPMVCSGYWLLPLFLWACLMILSVKALRSIRRADV